MWPDCQNSPAAGRLVVSSASSTPHTFLPVIWIITPINIWSHSWHHSRGSHHSNLFFFCFSNFTRTSFGFKEVYFTESSLEVVTLTAVFPLCIALSLHWRSYCGPSNMAGLAAGIARFYELCVTALFYPLSLYLPDSNTAWHFCWCIIQWGTNYPGSWYKEISSLPYCCSSSSYFVNREFPAAGHSTTHCKVNCIPLNCVLVAWKLKLSCSQDCLHEQCDKREKSACETQMNKIFMAISTSNVWSSYMIRS